MYIAVFDPEPLAAVLNGHKGVTGRRGVVM